MAESEREPESAGAAHISCGWLSRLHVFGSTPSMTVVDRLCSFVRDHGAEQYDAWKTHVPALQKECREIAEQDKASSGYSTILEYQLPYDLRRPDLVVLEGAAVVVVELKGHQGLGRAAFDQVQAYVRDLKAYHSSCSDRPVIPIVVSTGASRPPSYKQGVRLSHPLDLDGVLAEIAIANPGESLRAEAFVAPGTYVPLPTIVQAARQLFETRELPFIKRARAATEPALEEITRIAHQAAQDGTRHLVLLSGVPGSGKTLVGLQLVHSRWLDDLAEPRAGGRPTAAGVYLSGNGPLVRVLQDALKDAGGGGKTFVRPIKNYVEYYQKRAQLEPPEHLLVYDEAQRAHDAAQVAYVHKQEIGLSEPEHLVEFCSRVPRWNVLVALIGTGQAIHVGEEVGLPLWKQALEKMARGDRWTVHCSPEHAATFQSEFFDTAPSSRLNLNKELRFHLTSDIDQFVERTLNDDDSETASKLSDALWAEGHRFLLTHDLKAAKGYAKERYGEAPLARYGLLASSKDKLLVKHGVDNTFQTTKRLREGPWYNSDPASEQSCCQLDAVATEFASQGLELDYCVLAWGSDLVRENGKWSDRLSGGYQRKVENRLALRKNVYRVLLTRGRDGTVVFVPEAAEMRETYAWLKGVGFREL